MTVGAAWIAGWWGIRSVGQWALGRRRVDLAVVVVFLSLAALHIALAMS